MTDELKQWEYDKGYTKGYSDGRASLIEELEEIKAEAEEQNEDNWFAEMEEAEKRYEHEKWVESFDKGENNES